ncbi:hypothetical protein [Franzmannia qiaohouensis]|uniref:Uncharacterized protein n=1 Tax=Franzmannia qiaohouensis TaxID=1329370 RepID=A0ABU1HBY5_9GAMM|nr:hypothetical protein [Halomonas qiaohouensis]MDR5904871.1 hypothetical protein [Halomonas qiaohouensis]
MYKHVFEKRFANSSAAVEHIDATGWGYKGRHGVFSKYHLYSGVLMTINGEVSERLKLRLYPDGYVRLYADYSVNRTIGMVGLPMRVWESEDISSFIRQRLFQANDDLINNHGNQFCIEELWDKENGVRYGVFAMEKTDSGYGKVVVKSAMKIFETVKLAHEWAISKSDAQG